MRIVIDMQGAQTESRFRGIGRYVVSFAHAIVRNRENHEVILALNGLFPESIEAIQEAFGEILPRGSIRVWHSPDSSGECYDDPNRRRAELIREAFLASLNPDIVHVGSLFEGFADNSVSSIGAFDDSMPTSVSLYDLIPLLNSEQYLDPHPEFAQKYLQKIDYLKKADICLSISNFARQEGISTLELAKDKVINVGTAVGANFLPIQISEAATQNLKSRFSLNRPFVLYTGGADERKNLPRLIQAFASLPKAVRQQHQLLLAGKMPESHIAALKREAHISGLSSSELIFTGFISDEELVQLYNLCKLYVFPSWHEGFGLPALEAMACHAPVIGANKSSLPEVIGSKQALFDPFNTLSITEKITQGLLDQNFRSTLISHGAKQAEKFSWDISAKKAISAWEELHDEQKPRSTFPAYYRITKHLAKTTQAHDDNLHLDIAKSLAINEHSGLERQLLLDISELHSQDSGTGVQRVVRAYLLALLKSPPKDFRVEPVYATKGKNYRYARCFLAKLTCCDEIVYKDDFVVWRRGDIFFGLDMQHHVQLAHTDFYKNLRRDGVLVKFLVHDLLPVELPHMFKDPEAKELHERWLMMIAGLDGAICVSRTTLNSYREWICRKDIVKDPEFRLHWVHNGADIETAQCLNAPDNVNHSIFKQLQDRNTFLSVGTLEPRKEQRQILDAVDLLWKQGIDVNLIFIGREGWGVADLITKLCSHREYGRRLFWLEGVDDNYLAALYKKCSCLIAASHNEGFGLPLIEAARNDLPIVARDIPIFREIAGDNAYYFEGATSADLADALTQWLQCYLDSRHPKSHNIPWSSWQESSERLKSILTSSMHRPRQLFVDISELVHGDARSGIQRVVRNLVEEWLHNPPDKYRVEPVYATLDESYRYARKFCMNIFGFDRFIGKDEFIEYGPNDIFIGLDLQPHVVLAQRNFYRRLRQQGVRVEFVVYDLLCIQFPEFFRRQAKEDFQNWLSVVIEQDGAQCISRSVSDELASWITKNASSKIKHFNIDWFHLGADLDLSTRGTPSDADTILTSISRTTSFLMIGTVEPRKGHAQVLSAFEQLWESNKYVSLIIVGKQGWKVKELSRKIRTHPEFGKRLFWLSNVSDEYLTAIYNAGSCLIAASLGEGFGLPLIEAAQRGLSIIARDIPVFREVGGEGAFYFTASDGRELANSLSEWLVLYDCDQTPTPNNVHWMTWKQSAKQLANNLVKTDDNPNMKKNDLPLLEEISD